ncbi:ecto-NOX disulfide-thiol exchanger 2 isoform X2 [Tachyglossus aculeatus]|uniref:ecto-NOX disulfide-thiol exchanger 2 isoform X2 n=1 Tax=Tachyglossus aculeatus TaxID=9261 RepID=UPI0018F40E2D|nr:ecto-NOX disulfide-thiol exchanger 2 isoform X2 [Tachyglossus aculeatus]
MFLVHYAGLTPLPFDPAPSPAGVPALPEGPGDGEPGKKRRRRMSTATDGGRNLTPESTPMGLPATDPAAWTTAMTNLGLAPLGTPGHPLLPDLDPAVGVMSGVPPINPMMPGLAVIPPPVPPDGPVAKEIIHCKSCTLFPPNPNLPPPATRERPPGCKTVFVGGLPENGTEQIIVEVFEQCGDIIAIRRSKRNFCHIRFAEEFMVDKALYLSGYRIRLGSSTDKKDTSRLHVDFAQARDDLYEWECRQRTLAREERHRRRLREESTRPPSPPPVVHYSEHEAGLLTDRLKDEAQFLGAAHTLLTWMERGEVSRRNANSFYSMVQAAHGHARRLLADKADHDRALDQARERFKDALAAILLQFEQIVAVYRSAFKQKAWDHFTKAQRKNIRMWFKQAEEIRNIHNEELMGIRREEEMEMSDDDIEESAVGTKDGEEPAPVCQAEALKEENDSLRCQLDAYRKELELLKQEHGRHPRDQQLQTLNQALHGMQQHLLKVRDEFKKKETELEAVKGDKSQAEKLLAALKEQQALAAEEDRDRDAAGDQGDDGGGGDLRLRAAGQEREAPADRAAASSPVRSEREALLVGIISTFLHVHPFGASIEYICSYLQRLDAKICPGEVEALLTRLPQTFRQETSGVGASLEKRWSFCGFDGLKRT